MLPAGLPKPDREGRSDDGYNSAFWKGKDPGHAFRLRWPDTVDRGWMSNEYEVLDPKRGLESTRLCMGDQHFVLVMLKRWMEQYR